MHLQKGLVYLYTKKFLPLLLHFWNYNLSPNGKVIPYQRSSTPPNTAREGWMVQSIEDYSLWNIFNRINLRRGQTSTRYVSFPIFFAGWCIMFPYISWEGPSFIFCPGKKDHVFGEKIPSLQMIQKRSCAGAALSGKTIFSEGLKKISYFRVFFKKDHLSFSV